MICLISPMVNILVYMNLGSNFVHWSCCIDLKQGWKHGYHCVKTTWEQLRHKWRWRSYLPCYIKDENLNSNYCQHSCILFISIIHFMHNHVISLLILFSNEHKVTTFFCSSFFSPTWTDQNLVSSWISWIPSINNCRAGLLFCLNKLSEVTEILGQGKRKIKCSTVAMLKKAKNIFRKHSTLIIIYYTNGLTSLGKRRLLTYIFYNNK